MIPPSIQESTVDITTPYFGFIVKHITDNNWQHAPRLKAMDSISAEGYNHAHAIFQEGELLASHYHPHLDNILLDHADAQEALRPKIGLFKTKKDPYFQPRTHGLMAYTGSYYAHINRHLAGVHGQMNFAAANPERIQEWHADIQHAMATAPTLPFSTHVWSGMRDTRAQSFSKMREGDPVSMPAYTSSSITPYTAALFSEHEQHQHILHIHLKEGTRPGVYVESITPSPGEKEFLLNAGLKGTHQGITRWDYHDPSKGMDRTLTIHHVELNNA